MSFDTIIHIHPDLPVIVDAKSFGSAGAVNVELPDHRGKFTFFLHDRPDRDEVCAEIARLLKGGAVRPELTSPFTGLGILTVSEPAQRATVMLPEDVTARSE